MDQSWTKVVNSKNKKQLAQQEAMERIKDRYDDYYNDDRAIEMVDGLVETDVPENEDEDERLCSALKDMHSLPMNPHPPDITQEEADQLEKEYLENSYTTRSPWMRRAFTFSDNITYSKEDLIIPHYKETPKDGIVLLDKSDYVPIRQGWGICLLGMFAGRFPGKEGVFQLMKRWKVKARVSFHRKGWMFFQFYSEKDMEYTRQAGPFSQYGIPLILQPVPEKFKFDMVPEINIPVWIKLVDLEPYYWHENAIGKLASMVGVPVGADFKSLRKEAMDWPRIQVIIDASKPPKDTVMAKTFEGEEIVQKIEFEYIPKFCTKCKTFGHYMDGCKGAAESQRPQQPKAPPHQAKNRSLSRPGRPPLQQSKATPTLDRNRSQSRQGRAPPQQTKDLPQQGRNRSLSRLGRPPNRGSQPQQNRSKSRGEKPAGAVRYGWAVQPTEEEIKKHRYQKNWLDAEGKVIIHKGTNYPFLAGRGFQKKRMDPQPSNPPQETVTSTNRFEVLANEENVADVQAVPGAQPPATFMNMLELDKTPQHSTEDAVLGAQPPEPSSALKQNQVQATEEGVCSEKGGNEEKDSPIHGVLDPPDVLKEANADENTYIANLFNSPAQKTALNVAHRETVEIPNLPPKPNKHLYFHGNEDAEVQSEENELQCTPPPSKIPNVADCSDDEQQHDLNGDVPIDSLVVALKVPTSSEKRMGRRQREREKKREMLTATKRTTRLSSILTNPKGCVPHNPKMVSK